MHFSGMKNLLSLLLLLLTLSCTMSTQTSSSQLDKREAIKAIDNFYLALGSADTLLLQQTLTNDFYMFEHDEVWKTENLLELMTLTIGREWSVNDVHFESDQNNGHITYLNRGIIPSDRSWLESALLVKINDTIKIKFLHSTKLYLK